MKTHFPEMYRLYLILKARPQLPSQEEIDITSRKKIFDESGAANYLKKLKTTANILKAF